MECGTHVIRRLGQPVADPDRRWLLLRALSGSRVEHARVVARRLPLRGSLGPLLPLAVTGVLDIRLAPAAGGRTRLVADYRVSGRADGGLQAMAGPVDRVLDEQFDGLVRRAAAAPATEP